MNIGENHGSNKKLQNARNKKKKFNLSDQDTNEKGETRFGSRERAK